MRYLKHFIAAAGLAIGLAQAAYAQKQLRVKLVRQPLKNQVDVFVGNKPFTTFLFPDTLEKPVLFPIRTHTGTIVTRGFPLAPLPGEPTDHPHHIGMWMNFENVNGLDFWNNSSAIPAENKNRYGSIKTDKILSLSNGKKGMLEYLASWVNQAQEVLLEERTALEFSGTGNARVINRTTTFTAKQPVLFKDAKDGFLGLRVAKGLQLDESGNYLSSENKTGDSVWSTRAKWCRLTGKVNGEDVSITIEDHPSNKNYPTYWHARGYGLFAANPLGEAVFTNGQKATDLRLETGESVTFRYRVTIQSDNN